MLKSILRKSAKRALAPLAVAICLSFSSPAAQALDPIMPFSEVQQGMTGTAYTVVDSSREIRTFDVDIINGIGRGKGETPLIMARAYGPVVEQAGGILQGMSGSPVYVDGRLIGAVALGYKDMTPYTFFITPIEEMTKLWALPDNKNKTHIKSFDLKKYQEDKEKEAEKKASEKEETASQETAKKSEASGKSEDKKALEAALEKNAPAEADGKAEAATAEAKENPAGATAKPEEAKETPADSKEKGAAAKAEPAASEDKSAEKNAEKKDLLYLSGFSGGGIDFLQKKLPVGAYTIVPVSAPGLSDENTTYNPILPPGSSVGVAVAYGDFSISGVGTVTATDGKKILAFGHSFLHRGNVNYFMTDADVYGTIAGVSAGMKIAGVGNIIGRINQDRDAGIAGILGEYPSVVPVRVHVKDETLGRDVNYTSTVAYDEDLLPTLSSVIAYGAISKTSDTVSEATAKVSFSIRTNAVPSGKFERSNMFYSKADVGQVAVGELMQAVGIICTNTDQESDILDVKVDIDIDGTRKTASILSAVPDKKTAKPGETVKFTTTIKPYRKDKETLVIPYKVPENQPAGTLHLDVRGGGFVPTVSPLLILAQAGSDGVALDAPAKETTADQLKELKDTSRNNVITIAPGAPSQPLSDKEKRRLLENAKKAAEEAKKNPPAHKVELLKDEGDSAEKPGVTNFETGYIVDNVVRTTLKIEKK